MTDTYGDVYGDVYGAGAGGGGAPTTAGFLFEVAWDGSAYVDETAYTRPNLSPISAEYGRDQSSALTPSISGHASITLDNTSRRYSPRNAASPLYGTLKPGRPVRFTRTVDAVTYTLFTGHTDDQPINPDPDQRTVTLGLLDTLAKIRGQSVTTPMYRGIRTGDAIAAILDACDWPTDKRQLDAGATVIPWFWVDNEDVMTAIDAVVRSEGPPALLTTGVDGSVVFRDRYHRLLTPASQTVQAQLVDSVDPNPYFTAVTDDTPMALWRLDSTSGTISSDYMGSFNGTYTGSPTLNQTGLTLDTANRCPIFATTSLQYMQVNDAAGLLNPPSLTLEALIDSNGITGNNRIVEKGFIDGGWSLRIEGGNLRLFVFNRVTVNYPFADLNRHHVAGTYDANTGVGRLYLDGVQVASAQGTVGAAPSSTDPLRIAQKPGGSTNLDGWNGKLDEVAVYNKVLTPTRVAVHAAAAGFGPTTQVRMNRPGFSYDDGWSRIVNATQQNIEIRQPQRLQEVWTSDDTISLAAGESTIITAVPTDPVWIADPPIEDVDYTVASGAVTITLLRDSGMSIPVLIQASTAARITSLRLRAVPVTVARTIQVSKSDPGSIATYGRRGLPDDLPWCNRHDAAAVQDLAVRTRARPLSTVETRVRVGNDAATVAAVVGRDLSDLVTIKEAETVLNADFHLEHITHDIPETSGVGHSVSFGLEEAPAEVAPVFRFGDPGGTFGSGKFGRGIPEADHLLIFGSTTMGHRIGEGVWAL